MKNIKAGIAIQNPAELQMSVNGDRLEGFENEFTDLYQDKIQHALQHNDWGVWFKQIDELTPKFEVDIYPKIGRAHDYSVIRHIIKSNLPLDIAFQINGPYWNLNKFIDTNCANDRIQ